MDLGDIFIAIGVIFGLWGVGYTIFNVYQGLKWNAQTREFKRESLEHFQIEIRKDITELIEWVRSIDKELAAEEARITKQHDANWVPKEEVIGIPILVRNMPHLCGLLEKKV